MGKVIVVGNEKGGCGKTTTAMHLIISLLKLGFTVGTLDIDSRQQSLTRYIENRKNNNSKRPSNNQLACPEHFAVAKSADPDPITANQQEEEQFNKCFEFLSKFDFIVIDTPGSDSHLSRLAHQKADVVITPINDSFIDLDLIGVLDPENYDKSKPGIYAATVWEQKMKRAAQKGRELDWVVVRNRLSTTDAINKRNVEVALEKLSKRFGFRIAPGFGDRVIFKELFLHGLTLHDAREAKEVKMSTSVVAARLELRNFIVALNIPEIMQKVSEAESATNLKVANA